MFPMNPHSKIDIISIDYAVRSIVELLFQIRSGNTAFIISPPEAIRRRLPKKLITAIKDSFLYA